jgi:hypothetical protein
MHRILGIMNECLLYTRHCRGGKRNMIPSLSLKLKEKELDA